jgi:hypothetical protein
MLQPLLSQPLSSRTTIRLPRVDFTARQCTHVQSAAPRYITNNPTHFTANIKPTWQMCYSLFCSSVSVSSQGGEGNSPFKIMTVFATFLLIESKTEHVTWMYFQKENMFLVTFYRNCSCIKSLPFFVPYERSKVFIQPELTTKGLKIQPQHSVQELHYRHS